MHKRAQDQTFKIHACFFAMHPFYTTKQSTRANTDKQWQQKTSVENSLAPIKY